MNVLAFPELNEITKLNESAVVNENIRIFYRLYEVVAAGERRYAIYVKTSDETAFEIIGSNINSALNFYNLIISQAVLPCTLYDIIEDKKHESLYI